MSDGGAFTGRAVFVAAFIAVALFSNQYLEAQPVTDDLKPWILTIPLRNVSNNPGVEALGTTLADTFDLTLRLFGAYRVLPRRAEAEIPAAVRAGNPEALAVFAEANTIDYVLFGRVDRDAGGFVIEVDVFDRSAGAVTVRETATARSLFDVFDAADELTPRFLSAFAGQRIAFGTVRLQRSGWPEGEFTVLVDGTPAGRNITTINNVLIGQRLIEVVAETGPQTGERLFSAPVLIQEGRAIPIQFAMAEPPPPPPPPAPAPEPAPVEVVPPVALEPVIEEPEVVVEPADPLLAEPRVAESAPAPEPSADPEPSAAPEPAPPRALSDLTVAELIALRLLPVFQRRDYRGHIGSVGPALGVQWGRSLQPDRSAALEIWGDNDWTSGFVFSTRGGFSPALVGSEMAVTLPARSETEVAAQRDRVQSGAFEYRREHVLGLMSLAAGWRALERSYGPLSVDLVPQLEFGILWARYAITDAAGNVLDRVSEFATDPLQTSSGDLKNGRMFAWSWFLGPRVLLRAHYRALTARVSMGVAYDQFLDSSQGNERLFVGGVDTGRNAALGSGFSAYLNLGVGIAMGGTPIYGDAELARRLYARAYRGPARALSVGATVPFGTTSTLGTRYSGGLWLDFDRAVGLTYTLQMMGYSVRDDSGTATTDSNRSLGGIEAGMGWRWDLYTTEMLGVDVRALGLLGAGTPPGLQFDARLTWWRLMARLTVRHTNDIFRALNREYQGFWSIGLGVGATFGGQRRSNTLNRAARAAGIQ